MYIDLDSVEQYVNDYGSVVTNQYSFWEKHLNDGVKMKELEKRYNKKIWYCLCQNVIDLNSKSYAPKALVCYDLKNNAVSSSTFNDLIMEWDRIAPDSHANLNYMFILVILKAGKDKLKQQFSSFQWQ